MASKLELLLGLSKSIDDAAEAAASSGISGLAEELTNLYGILTDLITLGEAQLDDPTTADKYEELRETVDALVGIAAGAGAGIIFTAAVAGFGTLTIGATGVVIVSVGVGFIVDGFVGKLQEVGLTPVSAYIDYSGSQDDQTLIGTVRGDTLISGHGDDTIVGGFGDDLIVQHGGSDTIDGGAGYDTVTYINMTDGIELYSLDSTDLYVLHATGTDTLNGVNEINATAGSDTATLGAARSFDQMNLLGGNDTLVIVDGPTQFVFSPFIDAGGGDDILRFETVSQNGVFVSLAVGFAAFYDNGPGPVTGIANFETVIGTQNNDTIIGSNGSDTIKGGTGNDTLEGGDGNDVITGGADNDTIYGGEGRDIISGNFDDDLIYGGDDTDAVRGGDGNDIIYGGDGNDNLFGDDGDDIIYGGTGNDKLAGGAGVDVFVFSAGDGADFIRDFTVGEDWIDMNWITPPVGSINPDNDLVYSEQVYQSGSNVVIDFGGGDILTLANITLEEWGFTPIPPPPFEEPINHD